MNILLNNYCNLSCEYCFANKVMKENRKNMDIEDFRWLLKFLKKSNRSEVRLIGGEPTLHPHFLEILLESSENNYINHVHLFTNGTYPSKYNELYKLISSKKRFSILMNVNSKNKVGNKNYKRMINNINILSDIKKIRLTLGINFYMKNQDYNYIIVLARKYNIKNIRWSLVVPNSQDKLNNIKKYFKDNIPNIINFIKECRKNNINVHVDCNNIPICLLNDEQLRLLAMISERNLKTSVCNPVIDVKPDMRAIRCFAMNDYSVNIRDFNTIKQLKKNFIENVDKKYKDRLLFDKCKDCASYEINGESCACLVYRKYIEKE